MNDLEHAPLYAWICLIAAACGVVLVVVATIRGVVWLWRNAR